MNKLSKNTYIFLFTLLTGVLIISAFISYNKIKQFDESVKWLMHSDEVKSNISEVLSKLKDAETGQRGYLLTNDTVFLQPYIGTEEKINHLLAMLDTMVLYNPGQHNNFLTFKKLVSERFFLLKNNISILSTHQTNAVKDSLLLEGKNKMDEARKLVASMLREEDELLQKRLQTKNQSAAITPLYLMVFFLLSILALVLLFSRLRKETNLQILTQQINTLNESASKKIQQSENNLRNTILQSPVAMCIFKGPKHILELANERMGEVWGREINSIVGKPIFDSLPEARSQGQTLLDEVYETGKTFSANEAPVSLFRNGKIDTLYLNYVYEPYKEAAGNVTGIIAVATDVTEQVLARKQIEESELRFKLALRNSSQIVFTQDINLKHTWIYNQLPNFDVAAIIGKDDYELHANANAKTLTTIKKQVLETGKGSQKEVLLTINGEQIFYDLLIEPIKNDAGKVEGISGVALNITEKVIARKKIEESEQRIRLAVESGRLGTFEIDLANKEIIFSERLAEIFGIEYSHTWSHQDLKDALHPDDVAVRNKAHDLSLQTGILFYEARVVWKDNSVHWIRTSGRVIKDNTVATRLYGTVLDITEEKEAANKLATIRDQLELTLRMLPAAIQLRNSKGHLLFTNDEAARMTGFSSVEEMMKEKDPEYVYKNVINNLEIYDEEAKPFDVRSTPTAITFSTGRPAEAIFRTVNKHTGESNWIMSKSSALLDEEGKVFFVISTNTDITQQKKGEQELKRFKHMADNATEPFILMRQDGTFAYLNDIALERWGYTQEESRHIRVPDVDLIYNDEVFMEAFTKAQQGNIPTFETIHKKKDGTTYPVEVNMGGLILEGKPHMFAVARDIAERKKSEQKLKESEQRFQAAVAAVEGILWTNNANGEMQGEQPGWSLLTGQSIEQYQGYGWASAVHPDDAEPTIDAWNKSLAERKTFIFEHRLKKSDGTWGIFSIRAIPLINDDASIREWVGVHTEITQKRQIEQSLKDSEEKFRGLVETLPHLVWITNEKGEAVYASSSWEEYSGFNSYEVGNWPAIVHPEDMEPMTEAWLGSLETGNLYHAEARLRNMHDEYRWHVVEGVPLKNEEGKISKWIGAFTDINEQKLKEQKKDEFISIASHEMKTPITTAKGYLELLMLTIGQENPTAFLYANKATNAVQRLNDLVAELLDASKIQNGKLNYNISTFDFNEMLNETIENIQQGIRSHTITKHGKSLHNIKGDKHRLQQVIINLLSNAIKYSPNANSVLVEVEEKQNVLQVSVKDFGVGINKQHLDKIFDRYYRVQEHAIHFQGLGIGLYISYDIICRHEGTMWAESEPGSGSTFYFTIPIYLN